MASRIQIPFSFNYPSGGNLLPAAGASVGVYTRLPDGSQGSPVSVFVAQTGASQYSSLQTDAGGNVPGWVAEGTYHIVAAAAGGFGGGVVNFDALYGGGTSVIAQGVIDTMHLTTNLQTMLVPVGTILDHAASTPPAGFLTCDGSVVSQGTYSSLFASIGSAWNTGGEGAGNFRLPRLAGTTTIGAGTSSWGTIRTLGKYGIPTGGTYLGEETHRLTNGESGVPAHGHSVNDPGHAHNYLDGIIVLSGTAPLGPAQETVATAWADEARTTTGAFTGITVANNAAANAASTHNNMPPFAVVNKIIKY